MASHYERTNHPVGPRSLRFCTILHLSTWYLLLIRVLLVLPASTTLDRPPPYSVLFFSLFSILLILVAYYMCTRHRMDDEPLRYSSRPL
ncbi:hypothetical protein BR93DRAFT_449424 [Coniochaeta sp. PMI_546]|nr:hypothetical protein BR93DRAFT_449424 [Coniochaeta sp. PMI_546]